MEAKKEIVACDEALANEAAAAAQAIRSLYQYYILYICHHQLNRIHFYHQHFQCDVVFVCTFPSYFLSSPSSPFTKKLAIFTTIATTKTTSNISRDDCENDLAEAIPALQSAINSLNTLKPSDITVVRNIVHILLYCVGLIIEAKLFQRLSQKSESFLSPVLFEADIN